MVERQAQHEGVALRQAPPRGNASSEGSICCSSIIDGDAWEGTTRSMPEAIGAARPQGRNPQLLAELQRVLLTYQDAIRQRRIEEWHKNHKKLRGEPDMGDLINIE